MGADWTVHESRPIDPARMALIAVFVTALVTSQVTASKLLAFDLPVALPFAGGTLVLPGAALGIAVMFFASDCYAELYGRRPAQRLVNVTFFMNFVLLALVYSTILAPPLPDQPVDPEAYRAVLAQSTNIVIASMAAYLVSQNWDVIVFHALRERTRGRHLWLRNLVSTASSQLIDTVLFVALGFAVVPAVLGGSVRPVDTVVALVVGQYLLKLGLAVLDTPLVYGVVYGLRRVQVPDPSDRIP